MPDRDARISAHGAVNTAIEYLKLELEQGEPKAAVNLKEIEIIASQILEMVDRLADNSGIKDQPASEKSIKFLKSLLMQNGRGQLNGKNIDSFIKEHAGELTQNNVSGLIDDIKTNPKTVADWLDDVSDKSDSDYDPPEPDPRDEGAEPKEGAAKAGDKEVY